MIRKNVIIIILIGLSAFFLSCKPPSSPDPDTENPASDFEYTIADNEVEITNYVGTDTDVIIPAEIEGFPVTGLYSPENNSDGVFYNSSIESVVIPDTVVSIGDYAFYGCTSLNLIDIPDSVTDIGLQAFSSCSNLTSIVIPESVISIGSGVFRACTSLAEISVDPENAAFIVVDGVLFDFLQESLICCPPLGKSGDYTIPGTVSIIEAHAFRNCESLDSVTIPSSVTSMGTSCFLGCSGLTSIVIPDSVASLGSYAFYSCSNLDSVSILGSIVSIETSVFSHCENLSSVDIPASVTSIGQSAFSGCIELDSIDLPDLLDSIGYDSFAECRSLTSVEIPVSLSSISSSSFRGCSSLAEFTVAAGNPNYSTSDGVLFNFTKTNLLKYPIGKSGGSFIIPGAVATIDDDAFGECNLSVITIPASVTSIGERCFAYASALESVYINATVPPVMGNDYVFYEGHADRIIYVPESADDSIINAYKAADGWSQYADAIQEQP